MTSYNRTFLKALFVSGTTLSEDKMEKVFDSFYNIEENAVVIGPTGATISYTVLGPTGGTERALLGPTGSTFYYGMFRTGTTPSGPTATGIDGQIEIGPSSVYIYSAASGYWIHISGSTSF